MKPIRRMLSFFCALSLTYASAGSAADAAPPIINDGIQRPQRLKINVIYPGFPDREALVRVRFRVHADGSVSDVELMEGGFHEKRFVDATFTAMKTARFKPAMKNGVPLDDYYVVQPISFFVGQKQNGITPEFRAELNKVEKLIRSGDNAGAHFHAEWMLAEKAKLLYEFAALQAQLAHTHASVGNVHRAIAAARAGSERKSPASREFTLDELTIPNSASYYMLPKEIVINLLDMRFRLAASKGMLLESIFAYQELAGLTTIAADSPHAKTAATIVATLKGDKPLVAQLRVDESRVAWHKLFRSSFSIAAKTGTLERLGLVCAGKSRELAFVNGAEWTVPAGWEDCTVLIRAEPGVEFDLTEYTRAAAAVTPAG